MNRPLVSIVLITYNGKDLLARYLPSVIDLSYENKEIIIVDNASTDNTAEFLAERFPQVKVVRTDRNEGTGEGSNIGARAAAGDLVFWIHNDMYLPPDSLDRLVDRIMSDDRIAVCTCKVMKMTAEGERLDVIDSVGGGIDRYGFPTARGIGEQDRGQYDNVEKTFFSFGGPLLVRKSALGQVGGMDPKTLTLADDIDLCWRLRLAGYEVVVDTQTVIYHRLSATLNAFARENKRFLSERNTLRMLLKNYSSSSLLRVMPVYFGLMLSEMVFFVAKGKPQLARADMRALRWNLKNLGDTLAQRRKVQKSRKVPDRDLVSIMNPYSFKLAYFKHYASNKDDPSWRSYFSNA